MIAQSESFRHLGVEIKRGINPRLVEQAMPESALPDDDDEDTDAAENASEQGAATGMTAFGASMNNAGLTCLTTGTLLHCKDI